MERELTISKLDAAKRQLETAIRLYFHNGDTVSIHTLTAAAYNVIRDINNHRGGSPMWAKDIFLDFVKPEHKRTFRKKINHAENFFKHANVDPEEVLKFNPEQTEILFIDAVSQYYKLTGETPPLLSAFRIWFLAHHRDLFNLPDDLLARISVSISSVQTMNRLDYFNTIIPALMQP